MNIEVTPRMIGTLGRRIASLMREANASGELFSYADARLEGIVHTLSMLDVPCDVRMNAAEELYTSVRLAEQTFPVADGTAEQPECGQADFQMELISQGMFLDQPSVHGTKYTVCVYTYRLNWKANNVWLDAHPGHRSDAERRTREYLGIARDAKGWSFQPNAYTSDVLTVTHIEEVPDILPCFGEIPSLPEAKEGGSHAGDE